MTKENNLENTLKNEIQKVLTNNDLIQEENISIEVKNESVTLLGTVPYYSTKQHAEELVCEIAQVESVENNLRVKFPGVVRLPTDREIKNNINTIFLWNTSLYSDDIDVFVKNGTVVLEGTVDALWKVKKAEDLTGEILGVSEIKNKLVAVPTKSDKDKSIAQKIVHRIERNAIVKVQDLDIVVEKGRVTYTGIVDSLALKRAAEKAALETNGVTSIKNLLIVG